MTRREWLWLVVLLAAVVVRLAVLPTYPLNDTTEARYAEIGRQMVVTGDWVTPRIETERPFWGKPPLSFWLTAISFSLFGLSDLAARLPSLLLMLLTAWVVYDFARRTADREIGIAAAAIMMTTILGFVVAVIWLVHPLQTQSVTYVIQRCESLMGLFYLLTLYCVLRGATGRKPVGWYVLAVVACALGMGAGSVVRSADHCGNDRERAKRANGAWTNSAIHHGILPVRW